MRDHKRHFCSLWCGRLHAYARCACEPCAQMRGTNGATVFLRVCAREMASLVCFEGSEGWGSCIHKGKVFEQGRFWHGAARRWGTGSSAGRAWRGRLLQQTQRDKKILFRCRPKPWGTRWLPRGSTSACSVLVWHSARHKGGKLCDHTRWHPSATCAGCRHRNGDTRNAVSALMLGRPGTGRPERVENNVHQQQE